MIKHASKAIAVAAACCLTAILLLSNNTETTESPNTSSETTGISSQPWTERPSDRDSSTLDKHAYIKSLLAPGSDPFEQESSYRSIDLSETDRALFLRSVEDTKLSLLELEFRKAKVQRQGESKFLITIPPTPENDRLYLISNLVEKLEKLESVKSKRIETRKLVLLAEELIKADLGPGGFGATERTIELTLNPEPANSPYNDKYTFVVKNGNLSNRGTFPIPDTSGYTFLSPYVEIAFGGSKTKGDQ